MHPPLTICSLRLTLRTHTSIQSNGNGGVQIKLARALGAK